MSDPFRRFRPRLRLLSALAALPLLGGCHMIVLDPAGDVARQQGNLVILSTVLMLLIIVPVMALTALFAWKYRARNADARYEPEWDHSTSLELVIWAAPLLIIICLGALTWVGTHMLDPYRPLARTAPGQAVAADVKPLDVEVVALDWKWLFIYPEYGVATVNELAAPVGRPIRFRISASSVMNSFYVPALAGQIYAMPGMETSLHAVFNETGRFRGFSANYSGHGFSHMRFDALSLNDGDFAAWVANAKAGSAGKLDRAAYLELERPSENAPVARYASVDPDLFDAVVNLCVEPGKMCMGDMMAIDAKGGMGEAGKYNVRQLTYDKFKGRGTQAPPTRAVIAALCADGTLPTARRPDAPIADLAPLAGKGLTAPARQARSPLVAAAEAMTPPARPRS
ncbi:MAG: ubiquinol oxidase subunit II [Pseudomonadota bacterium]